MLHELMVHQGVLYADFNERPKSKMLELSVNPYSGKVLLKLGKQEKCGEVALDVMRYLVRACNVLERNGSSDPLRDLLSHDGENLPLTQEEAAELELLVFGKRRTDSGDDDAAQGLQDVGKAS